MIDYKEVIIDTCCNMICENCNETRYDGHAGGSGAHTPCEGSQCGNAVEDFLDYLETIGIILSEKSDIATVRAVSALHNIPLKEFGIEIDKQKQEKEIQMIKVIKETLKKYKLAVTLPGATDDNTTVTIDTKANKIYLEVDYSKTAKYVKEQLDLEHEGVFDIPERFEVSRVEYDINAGLVEMEIPVDSRVKVIKSKSAKKKAIKKDETKK